jgi:hypothetical protein
MLNIMQDQNNTLNQLSNLPSESPGYIIIQGVWWHKKQTNKQKEIVIISGCSSRNITDLEENVH